MGALIWLGGGCGTKFCLTLASMQPFPFQPILDGGNGSEAEGLQWGSLQNVELCVIPKLNHSLAWKICICNILRVMQLYYLGTRGQLFENPCTAQYCKCWLCKGPILQMKHFWILPVMLSLLDLSPISWVDKRAEIHLGRSFTELEWMFGLLQSLASTSLKMFLVCRKRLPIVHKLQQTFIFPYICSTKLQLLSVLGIPKSQSFPSVLCTVTWW